ncbi:MAG TPA: VCBS repeat-containing protein [Sandaracinaceae bacterium LLY-WYZ-13_1]|nr:VCBS repeat-containing protein [Sandaracinaceae bacterium LLY-WYZ-13_1]
MRAPFPWISTTLLTLALAGCDCGGGTSEPCTSDEACETGEVCVDGTCEPGVDGGPGFDAGGGDPDAGDDDPDAGACGACPPPARCRFDTCVPDLGTCETNEDCPGDSYCSADGECLPYGVPPDVVNDPSCQRRDVLEDVLPVVQCEWAGPADDDVEPRSGAIYTAPIVADLNLDEDPGRLQPSIVTTTFHSDGSLGSGASWTRVGMLRIFDGRTCEEQLHFGGPDEDGADGDNPNRPGYGTQWAVADLDGDVESGGRPELIGMRRRRLGVGDPTPPRLELYAIQLRVEAGAPTAERLWVGRDCDSGEPVRFATNGANYGPGVFDLNDDGAPEVLVGTMVFDHEGCLLNTPEADDIGDPGIYVTHGPMHTAADVDADGRVELIAGHRIATFNPATSEWEEPTWFTPSSAHRTGHTAVVDLGQYSALPGTPLPNSLPEVVVVSAESFDAGTESTGTIRVQALDGTVVFGPLDLYHVPADYPHAGKGGAPTASDFDGDGQVELAAAAGDYYAVYDPDCDADPDVSPAERPGGTCDRSPAMAGLPEGILWAQPSQDRSSNATGSSVFDFNGDGTAEVVYRDECFLRVYDGPTGEVIFSRSGSSGTGYELPVIVDVDGDFATEIVVARTARDACPSHDPLFGDGTEVPFEAAEGFIVLRDPEDRWASSRPIWNQHAYSVTHVTDDGRVVRTRDWAQNWLEPGLNNFRQNVQGDLGRLDIADLTVVFFDLAELCTTELPAELDLTARVCNRGTNPVGDGVLVHFAEDESLVCETTTTRLLNPGECEEVSCRGTVTSAEDLIARVDPMDEIADCRPGNDEGVPAASLCIF